MSMSDFVISLALVFLAVYLIYETIVLAKGDKTPALSYLAGVAFVSVMIGLVGFAVIYKGIVE